jgi:hypothetical protein
MVGDRLLGDEEMVRAADAPAQPRGVELLGQRAGELGGVGDDEDGVVEPADERRELAAADVRGHRQEREMGVGEPHERERLARRDRARLVAAVEDRVPAAPVQRGGQLVGAVGMLRVDLPALLGEPRDEQRGVGGRNVHHQRAQIPVQPHIICIGLTRLRLSVRRGRTLVFPSISGASRASAR